MGESEKRGPSWWSAWKAVEDLEDATGLPVTIKLFRPRTEGGRWKPASVVVRLHENAHGPTGSLERRVDLTFGRGGTCETAPAAIWRAAVALLDAVEGTPPFVG